MGMLQSKLPLIITVAPDSCIVNRQIGVKVSKFFGCYWPPLPTNHVTQRMRNGHFRLYNAAYHNNGRKTRDSERRHFKFVTLLDLGKLE